MLDLSFNEIREKVTKLSLPQFDLIVGIGTGGVVPASLIAYKTGIELRIIKINYRDEKNNPQYDEPVILSNIDNKISNKKILLIDDVAVTGKTLETAKSILQGNIIETLVFKGNADYVLFPKINTCVNWPWRIKWND